MISKNTRFKLFLLALLVFPTWAISSTGLALIVETLERMGQPNEYRAALQDDTFCPIPTTINFTAIVSDALDIHWERGGASETTTWEIVIQPRGSGLPQEGELMTVNRIRKEGLTPDTDYEFYIRTHCEVNGQDIQTEWGEPSYFRTTLVPVALPYLEDFENNPTFGFSNDLTNQWVIGTAVANSGTKALYVSNDGGATNTYTTRVAQVSHVYKDVFFPEGPVDLLVTFDWRNIGERGMDDFRVWLVRSSYTPQSGTRILASESNGMQLDRNQFYGQMEFSTAELQRDITRFTNQSMRLIFEWKNDDRNGVSPAAAIDNLKVIATQCQRPTRLNVEDITQTTAAVSWRNADNVSLYDVYVATTPTAPNDETIPTYAGVENPQTLSNLLPNTRYYVWVRSACSPTNTSLWIGGNSFLTLQIPAVLPLNDNFEGDFQWSTTVDAANNWIVGTAINNGGNRALYISDDDFSYQYNSELSAVSHVYRDIAIPHDAEELTLTFDWHVEGLMLYQYPFDYMRVIKSTTEEVPTSGEELDVFGNNQLLGRVVYVDSDGWKTEALRVDVTENQGEVIRLVFEWDNINSEVDHLPAALDNIKVEVSRCQSPTNLKAEIIRYTNNFRFTWTPGGNETQWEFYTALQGTTPPDVHQVGTRVEGEPIFEIEQVEAGQFYVFYVRAICQEGDEENKTAWVGPVPYSYFIPPICAELDAAVDGMPNREDDTYVLCEEGPVSKTLRASYIDIKQTNEYKVEAIEYAPPFPFFGGDMVRLTEDDEWSDLIDLNFDFCFYGNSYNKVLVSTNGTITFSIEGEVEDGRYSPYGWSEWQFSNPIPYPSEGIDAPFLNAVFGVMQDLDPRYSPLDHSVNYQVLGTFPCRALVFNVYRLGLYDMAFDPEDVEGTTQTSQIVLYEATNIIDVYVKNRPVLPESPDRHNKANGVIGIQNADGTVAHYPGMYPGDNINRNTGDWITQNEAWRFTPDGESTVTFKWFKEGVFVSSEEVIDVEITESTSYTAKAVYMDCLGQETEIERYFHFVKEDVGVEVIPNYVICGNTTDVNGAVSVSKGDIQAYIDQLVGDEHSANYDITYFTDEDLTLPLEEMSMVQDTQTIYVKLYNRITKCTMIKVFDLVRMPPIKVSRFAPVEACSSYVLPQLKEGEHYFAESRGQGVEYFPGEVYEVAGESTLYVYKQVEDCFGEEPFLIKLNDLITADQLEDQLMQCENFVLPALSTGNAYYTEPNAGGIKLQEGMEIMVPMTIYIHAINGNTTAACSDESHFAVSYDECPIPRGFSPNGDGINDAFDLSQHGITKIQIFNRNGREVYAHGEKYTNQFVGKDKNGNQLPAATYYYIVISHGKQRTGWVQINY